MFGRKDNPPQLDPDVVKLIRDVARCQAAVESLEMQWIAYRDELKRLATRLEKRDQRAVAASQTAMELAGGTGQAPAVAASGSASVDPITAAVLRRRNGHAVRRDE